MLENQELIQETMENAGALPANEVNTGNKLGTGQKVAIAIGVGTLVYLGVKGIKKGVAWLKSRNQNKDAAQTVAEEEAK